MGQRRFQLALLLLAAAGLTAGELFSGPADFNATSPADEVLSVQADASVLLREGRPSFVYYNSTCDASNHTECLDWLAVSLQDVYESSGGGVGQGAVPGRSGADVLDPSGLAWTRGRRAVGSPPVEVEYASITVPQKAGSLAACPGSGGPPAAGPPASITLELLLAGQDFNLTTLPGNDRTRTEVLAGNAKWTLTAENWPFCAPGNALAATFGFLSADSGSPPVAKNGSELADMIAEQGRNLTGAADPGSVPVTGAAAPSAEEPVQSSGQVEADLEQLVASDPALAAADGTGDQPAGGRRKLQRGFGSRGFGFGSRKSGSSSKPSPVSNKGTQTSVPRSTPVRPFWPNGGTSRPRYPTQAAAVSGLPFTAAQRGVLGNRFALGRPVYGLGRRPFLPFHYFLFFPLLGGAGMAHGLGHGLGHQAKLDLDTNVVVDNSTLAVARLGFPPPGADGAHRVTVFLPHFEESVVYDPVVAIGPSEEAMDGAITDAINSVMAYNETGAPLGTGGAAGALVSALPLAAALLLGMIGVLL